MSKGVAEKLENWDLFTQLHEYRLKYRFDWAPSDWAQPLGSRFLNLRDKRELIFSPVLTMLPLTQQSLWVRGGCLRLRPRPGIWVGEIRVLHANSVNPFLFAGAEGSVCHCFVSRTWRPGNALIKAIGVQAALQLRPRLDRMDLTEATLIFLRKNA